MRRALLVAALALCACAGEPVERPALAKKGQPAPALDLPKLLNAPEKSLRGWGDLEGKAVVLEFWATWCGPCVESIPEFNRLAERFRGKPVVFIHITDESEEDVREFLKANPISGWVAPEAGAAAFKAFRVFGRPHTVLIGRDGRVAGFANAGLTPEDVMELLAGHAPGAAARPAAPPALSTSAALAEFYLARSEKTAGRAQYGPASLTASAMRLEYALEWLYGRVDKFDVKSSAARQMAGHYDIRFSVPEERAALKKELFLKGLEAALGLRTSRSEREAEVYVLKRAPGGPVNVKPRREFGSATLDGVTLEVRGGDFGTVASRLKDVLGEPVFDETGDRGLYDYDFELDSTEPKAIDLLLQKQLGLRLARLRRKIQVVEVSGPAQK